jgi:hypothetical protein
MSTKKLTDTDVSNIDQALAKARARKQTRDGKPAEATTKAAKPAKEPSAPKKPRLTDEEKAARAEQKNAERVAKKAERDAARAAKRAEKSAGKSPAHMRKVMKAAERLGSLGQAAELLLNEATANLTAAELSTLAQHIQHFNRVRATERALGQKVEAGQTVKIVGGDSRHIGRTGTVTKAQRIRCYVSVGEGKPLYLFTSDVQVEAQAEAKAG